MRPPDLMRDLQRLHSRIGSTSEGSSFFGLFNPLANRPHLQLIHWSLGSILVTGPKAEVFFECFCEHKVALVKSDAKDIMRVTNGIA